jgi:hypothetical protein
MRETGVLPKTPFTTFARSFSVRTLQQGQMRQTIRQEQLCSVGKRHSGNRLPLACDLARLCRRYQVFLFGLSLTPVACFK